jgi:RNA-directed DNA polymerase
MKRKGNLYQSIISIENLTLAGEMAQRGKKKQYGVQLYNKNKEPNILALHESLKNRTYKPSPYKTFPVNDPKPREIFAAPFYPDRIVHYAVMLVLENIFVSTFTTDTYSCIKGKGVHAMASAIQCALNDSEAAVYCLKIDVKKFYPSVDHDILKLLLRRKFKDADLLWLLDIIIDSAPGLPIGNYLSQYFANFYLAYFDHTIKEKMQVKRYFRYCDDMAFLSNSKPYLHQLLSDIRNYLEQHLKLTIKGNYQIFIIEKRGIDMGGYVHRRQYVRLRPRIKKRFARMLVNRRNKSSVAAYCGWASPKHCKSRNLLKKLL